MFKLILSLFLFSVSLFAGQISICATVGAHADTHMQTIYADTQTIKEGIYLKTNHSGLTIALTEDSQIRSAMVNSMPLTTSPMPLSDNMYLTSTKVAELVISQEENHGTLAVTISVK